MFCNQPADGYNGICMSVFAPTEARLGVLGHVHHITGAPNHRRIHITSQVCLPLLLHQLLSWARSVLLRMP